MKSKKLAVFLLTLVLTLGLFPMSVFAASTQKDVTESSTASITVNGAVENDVLAAYKVIDITYVSASNTLKYEWNSAFANYFTSTTVEEFAALNSDQLKEKLAGLPKYIADNSIAAAKTATVDENGNATFADLAMGEYFIRPTSSTSVYQLMLQKIEPTIVDGTYKIDDVTFNAKHEEVTITKEADKTSVTKNEKVAYTVTVDVPTYSAEATDKSFYVSDLLPDGLTLDTASIKVSADGTDITGQAGTTYTLDTTATDEYTFKLSVDSTQYTDNWSANSGKQLVITYAATLNDDATTEVNTKETNTATFDYSFYPYAADTHNKKTATVDVTTFAIKIDKFKDGSTETKLANAKFDLYRTATQDEITAGTGIVTIPHTSIQGIKLEGDIATNENGEATFAKYEANGTNYDYYLVETQAPSGYNLLDSAVKVNFTDAEVEATAGIYTVKVPNKSGFILPITGGEGTVLFTVLGIAFMGGAVFLFVISRRKSKASSKK